MKIPITKHDTDLVKTCIVLVVAMFALLIVPYFPRADEFPGGFWEYAVQGWYGWIGVAICSFFFLYGPISALREYDVQPEGLYILPRYGKNKDTFIPWTELEYVGPIRWGWGGAGPSKLFVCCPKYPYRDKHGCCALVKGTKVITYTPEAKYVLENYCPIYSTEFENWQIDN